MFPLTSSLTSQVQEFDTFRGTAADFGFSLGGGWEFDRGSFDCALDEANKVWLRLPFRTTIGNIDSEAEETDAKIRFDEPYVLKHVYNEGLDGEARAGAMGAVLNQFSDPVEADAAVEPMWIDKARAKLRQIERIFPA